MTEFCPKHLRETHSMRVSNKKQRYVPHLLQAQQSLDIHDTIQLEFIFQLKEVLAMIVCECLWFWQKIKLYQILQSSEKSFLEFSIL